MFLLRTPVFVSSASPAMQAGMTADFATVARTLSGSSCLIYRENVDFHNVWF